MDALDIRNTSHCVHFNYSPRSPSRIYLPLARKLGVNSIQDLPNVLAPSLQSISFHLLSNEQLLHASILLTQVSPVHLPVANITTLHLLVIGLYPHDTSINIYPLLQRFKNLRTIIVEGIDPDDLEDDYMTPYFWNTAEHGHDSQETRFSKLSTIFFVLPTMDLHVRSVRIVLRAITAFVRRQRAFGFPIRNVGFNYLPPLSQEVDELRGEVESLEVVDYVDCFTWFDEYYHYVD
jgi:hypothetical protein